MLVQLKCVHVCLISGNASVCGPNNLSQCLYPKYDYFMTNNLLSSCQCPDQCSKLTYNYVVSQAAASNLAVEWMQSILRFSRKTLTANYLCLEVRACVEYYLLHFLTENIITRHRRLALITAIDTSGRRC